MSKKVNLVSYLFVIFSFVGLLGLFLIIINQNVLLGVGLVLASALIPITFSYAFKLTDDEMKAKPELKNNSFFKLSYRFYRIITWVVVLAVLVIIVMQLSHK